MTRARNASVARAVTRAVRFLSTRQLPHGEFKTYSAADRDLRTNRSFFSSVFVTALVVHCLERVSGDEADQIKIKAIRFVASEMEMPGVWRYWSSRSGKHRSLPPDLDDTCCVAHALSRAGRPLPAHRDIIVANQDPRGAFFTWLVPRASFAPDLRAAVEPLADPTSLITLITSGGINDVDCVVNANVLLYLGDSRETEGASWHLVETVLESQEAGCSGYYPDPLAFYYMASRAYSFGVRSLEPIVGPVAERVRSLREQDGWNGDPMKTALRISTLLNLEGPSSDTEGGMIRLVEEQQEDGSWEASALYRDETSYYGSEELTTGLCLEALVRSGEESGTG